MIAEPADQRVIQGIPDLAHREQAAGDECRQACGADEKGEEIKAQLGGGKSCAGVAQAVSKHQPAAGSLQGCVGRCHAETSGRRIAIMNACLRHHQPLGQWFVCTTRVLCNGKTSAFQADDTGSIPVTRSVHNRRSVVSSSASSSTKLLLCSGISTPLKLAGSAGKSLGLGNDVSITRFQGEAGIGNSKLRLSL